MKDIIKKWYDMLEKLNFSQEYIEKIAKYAERHAILESTNSMTSGGIALTEIKLPSTLPISLNVLSKIKDLSKVNFIDHQLAKMENVLMIMKF